MAAKSRGQRKTKAGKKRAPAGRGPRRRTTAARKEKHLGVVEAAVAAFAHEVRTPLTGILAISDLLATSDLGAREKRWVDTIKAGAEHLSALATVFVDAARPDKTKAAIREDLFDLRVLARMAGDSLAGRAAAKGLACEIDISESVPSLVLGDSIRLRAALENLIDNAVKFTERGGVALGVSVTRRDERNVRVAFAVSDSGIGLTMQEIKRLFRPFSQANVGIASRFGGAGLGLSSIKQLARAMGGDVKPVQRRAGGTIFTLTVTLKIADLPMASSRVTGEQKLQTPRALRVLSVEDNPFGRVVLNTILTELGHQAEFVGRGEDAARRIEQGAFDCVLMDMVLPGIDGVEAIKHIRKLGAPHGRISIVGVSGRSADEAAARTAGADAFLLKPVSPRALAIALLEATSRAAAAT
jgi:CheY-like chemotaxis protein